MLYLVGTLDPEGEALVHGCMESLGLPYRVSSFKDGNLFLDKPFILQEIAQLKPEAVMCLGTAAMSLFTPRSVETMALAKGIADASVGDIPVRVTYNPKYLIKQGGVRSKSYLTMQADIRGAYADYSDAYEERTVPVAVFGTSPPEVREFIATFARSERVALDYEGSGLDPLQESFELGGVGLSDGERAAYLCVRSYESGRYDFPADARRRVGHFLTLLAKRRVLAFNANYEHLVTLNVFGIHLDGIVDVMQNLRTLDIRGGLKDITQKHLGLRGWTRELDHWRESLADVFPAFRPLNTKAGPKDRAEWGVLRDKGIVAAVEFVRSRELVRTPALVAAIERVLAESVKLWGSEGRGLELLEQYLRHKHARGDWDAGVRYTEVPRAIIGRYCGLDCHNTVLLDDKYRPELARRGLEQAAEYYNQQMRFGIEAELAGFVWNDARAAALKAEYTVLALDALRRFLLTRRAMGALGLTQLQELEVRSATDVEQLKRFFNPNNNAPENTAVLSRILCSDSIRMGVLFSTLSTTLQNDESRAPEFPVLGKLLAGFHREIPGYHKLAKQSILAAKAAGRLTLSEVGAIVSAARYELPDAAAETVEALASAASRYLGVDLEDEATWTDDYRAVFYAKLFKKVDKVISAFIDGRNGREVVSVARRERDPGRDYLTRVGPYRPDLAEGEIHLYEPHYNVNATVTRRWSSSYHGIPSNSDIRVAFEPFWADGFFGKLDYSQMELRTMAALAGEESLLQAFRDGKDIHRFIASAIFDKPEGEISDAERGWSKKASFGFVYGKSVATFAEEYFRGDVPKTVAFFAKIYGMFPRLRDYIERQTQQLFDEGYVTTIWGDPIYIEYDRGKKSSVNEAIRFAVNYPIQSTASNVTGVTGYELTNWKRERDFEFVVPGFSHDCLEPLLPGRELIPFLERAIEFAEEVPWKKFKLPIKIDVEFGVSAGELVQLRRLGGEGSYVAGGELRCTFEGRSPDVASFLRRLKMTHTFRVEDMRRQEKYSSWSDLYLKTNSSYHSLMGKHYQQTSGTLTARAK
jgi:hypothetical protein